MRCNGRIFYEDVTKWAWPSTHIVCLRCNQSSRRGVIRRRVPRTTPWPRSRFQAAPAAIEVAAEVATEIAAEVAAAKGGNAIRSQDDDQEQFVLGRLRVLESRSRGPFEYHPSLHCAHVRLLRK